MLQSGDVVELVDTLGLEPSAARRGGPTPSIPTMCIFQKFLTVKINNYYERALEKNLYLIKYNTIFQ